MTTYVLELCARHASDHFSRADLAMVMESIVRAQVSHRDVACIGISLHFHVGPTILGLGLIIQQSILLFNIVEWCGVAYLVYIGIRFSWPVQPQWWNEGRTPREHVPTGGEGVRTWICSQCAEPKAGFFLPLHFRQCRQLKHAACRKVWLRCRDGDLPGDVVRRCKLFHDDATHACSIFKSKQMDRSRQRRCLHRSRNQIGNPKGRLRTGRTQAAKAPDFPRLERAGILDVQAV